MNPDIDVAEEIKEKDKKEHEILSKYKIILLGDEHVGKTAILKQFVYQTFDECYKVQKYLYTYNFIKYISQP